MTPTQTAAPTEHSADQLSILAFGCAQLPSVESTIARVRLHCATQRIECRSIDVDDEPALAVALRVITIPTVIAYESGLEVDRVQGPLSQRRLDRFLRSLPTEPAAPLGPVPTEHPELLPVIPKTSRSRIRRLLTAVRSAAATKPTPQQQGEQSWLQTTRSSSD